MAKDTLLLDYKTIATLNQYLSDLLSCEEQQLLITINSIKYTIQQTPYLKKYYNTQLDTFNKKVKGDVEIKELLSKIQKNYELDNKSLDINLLGSSDIEKELPAIEKSGYFYAHIHNFLSPIPFIDGSAMVMMGSSSLCKFLCDVLTLYILKSPNRNTFCQNESYTDTGYHDFRQYCPGYLYDFYIFDSEDRLLNFGYFKDYLMIIFKIATANVLRQLIIYLKKRNDDIIELKKKLASLTYNEETKTFYLDEKSLDLTTSELETMQEVLKPVISQKHNSEVKHKHSRNVVNINKLFSKQLNTEEKVIIAQRGKFYKLNNDIIEYS